MLYLFVFLVIVCLFMLRLFGVVNDQLQAPFDLVFESPNLATIKIIQAGKNPYSPDIYARNPFVITLYTPLYHYVTALFPVPKANPFFYGRIVAMISMFLSAFTLLGVNKKNQIPLLPFIAMGVFFSFWDVINNTAFLKNDPMALFFSALAVVGVHHSRSRRGLILTAFFCVCALTAKQSYLSASLTCTVYLLLSNRRHFLTFFAALCLLATAFILTTVFKWGSGFWFSTVFALGQDISAGYVLHLIGHVAQQPLAWFLTAMSLLSTIIAFRRKLWRVFRESPYFIYLLISLGILFATAGKRGASGNYFFEFYLSQLMWIVFVFGNLADPSRKRLFLPIITAAFVLCSGLEFHLAEQSDYSYANKRSIPVVKAYYRQMNQQIGRLGIAEPKILNPFTHVHAYSISDRLYLNDPFQYNLLWQQGLLDYEPLLKNIREGFFDIIMLPSDKTRLARIRGPRRIIVDEIMNRYVVGTSGCGYDYYVRADDR